MQELRRIRRAKDITQEELGRQVGLTAAGISALERGDSKARQDTLINLADALDVTVDELLGRHPKAAAPSPPEVSDEERRADFDMLRGMLTGAGARTDHLTLPEDEFEGLWEGKSAERRAQLNQGLLEEYRLLKPLLRRWASMPPSKGRSRLHRLWLLVLGRTMRIAVEKNLAAAEAEADIARKAGDEARAAEELKVAKDFFAKVA